MAFNETYYVQTINWVGDWWLPWFKQNYSSNEVILNVLIARVTT